MVFEDLVIGTLALAAAASVFGAAYFLPRIRRVILEEKEAASILHDMLGELKERLHIMEQRLADQLVRLDALEMRIGRVGVPETPKGESPVLSAMRSELAQLRSRLAAEPEMTQPVAATRRRPTPRERATETEAGILRFLLEGPKTPVDIRKKVGRSREHTARLLKKLYDQGYVVRSEVRKPFQYELTNGGRRLAMG